MREATAPSPKMPPGCQGLRTPYWQGRPTYLLVAALWGAAIPGLAWAEGSRASVPSPTRAKPLEARLHRLEGGRLRLSQLRGQPVLLELWATWCQPCREQARIIRDLDSELDRRSVRVLEVNQGEGDQVVDEFVARNPSDHTVVLDRGQLVSRLLEIEELPAIALLDRGGTVVGVRSGVTQRGELLQLLAEIE